MFVDIICLVGVGFFVYVCFFVFVWGVTCDFAFAVFAVAIGCGCCRCLLMFAWVVVMFVDFVGVCVVYCYLV